MRKVLLNDVLLRESAQVAGGAMSPADQTRYLEYLIKNGMDIIEIGYPAKEKSDEFKKCLEICEAVKSMHLEKRPILSGLAMASEISILAVKQSGCDMLHFYIPTSDQLVLAQFNDAKYGSNLGEKRQWILAKAVAMVKYAKSLGFEHIQFSPEDAARTNREFLCQVVEAVIDAGATSVNIPDTTGLCILEDFGDLIKHLFQNVSNIQKARIACHCHNDSGCGTANALQGIANGIGEVQGTFYGLGERSGMTSFESIIMNVLTAKDLGREPLSKIEISFNEGVIVELVNFVADSLGMSLPRHWVVAGEQNGICSSGTHQSIEAKAKKNGLASGYYSWNPARYGHAKVRTVITQYSGKVGLRERLTALGFCVDDEQLEAISEEVKRLSSEKKSVSLSDREITAIVGELIKKIPYSLKVKKLSALGGKGTIPYAAVEIFSQGKISKQSFMGNGPIAAIFDAVVAAAADLYPVLNNFNVTLEDCRLVPITVGNEALGDFYVRIKTVSIKGNATLFYSGRSVNDDTNQAFAQATANALSWCIAACA